VKAALAVDGTVVWSARIAARPPALSATAAVERDAVRVSWTARPRVPVDVLAIDPESKTRRPVGRRIVASPMRVPIAALPGGPVAFLVRAAAGLREATVTTTPVALPSRAPTVEILAAPGDSPAGQPVTLRGAVVDSWGRVTPDAVIEWTLNGTVVGTGSSVTIAPPPGRHELGAAVRNQKARQSVTVRVSEPTADAIRWRRALENARRGATRPGRVSPGSPAGPSASFS